MKKVGKDKYLIHSDEELLELLDGVDLIHLEHFLDIRFAYKGGSFERVGYRHNANYEPTSNELDKNIFRRIESSIMPEKYPCIVEVRFTDIDCYGNYYDKSGNNPKFIDFIDWEYPPNAALINFNWVKLRSFIDNLFKMS